MLLLPQTLSLADASDALRLLEVAIGRDGGERIVVDASPLQRFDSSALTVLLECRRQAQAWGKPFELKRAPPALLRLARLYGVHDLLTAA